MTKVDKATELLEKKVTVGVRTKEHDRRPETKENEYILKNSYINNIISFTTYEYASLN